MVGETWKAIQRMNVYPYFDRVESEANPVGGLSRGRREGPWKQVDTAKLPEDLAEQFAAARAAANQG